MTDLSKTVAPKSDQQNAEDYLSGPKTITITGVSADTASREQPIKISFEGDENRPWKPCLTMRRLLIALWGPNGNDYVGRRLTLYRDPETQWGGLKVGGIRVSHASHIEKQMTIALTETRGKKKPITVKTLENPQQQQPSTPTQQDPYADYAREFKRRLDNEPWQAVDSWWSNTEADREGMAAERVEKMEAALAAKIEKENG
jgi:hypothetical protein